MSTKTRGDSGVRSLWHRAAPWPATLAALALTLGGCSLLVDAGSYGSKANDGGASDGATPDGATPDGATPDGSAPDGGATDGATPDVGLPDGGMTDGGTDGGSPDAPPSCTFPRTMCGGECVDTSRDPRYCGSCTNPCGDGETCRDGACQPFCQCDPGQICLADGSCIDAGSCDGPPAPTCAGGDAASGELQAMRLAIFDADSQPADVHIAQNPVAEAPGWVLLWRTMESGGIEWAFTSVHADDIGATCYVASPSTGPGSVMNCGMSDAPRAELSDARTMYWSDPSESPPTTYLATATTAAPATVELWKVDSDESSAGVPTSVCAERTNSWSSGFTEVVDLSIVPQITAGRPRVDAALDTDSGIVPALLRPTETDPDLSPSGGTPPPDITQVAANLGRTAFASGSELHVWNGARFQSPSVGALAPNLVAAVNPFSSDSDAFFFATQRDTGRLKAVGCTSSSGCAEVRSEISGIPGAPIAAYSHTDESGSNVVRFLIVEAAPADGAQIRRYRLPAPAPAPPPPPPVPVLTGESVGGRIEDVIALDAEVIEDVALDGAVVGRLRVWAAVVKVSRGGEETVELWTGAYRQCP